MHGHVDAAAGIAAGGPETFTQAGIIVYPALQLAVGHLRIEFREITLGQLGAAIGTDDEMFHKFLSDVVFTVVKILKISGNSMPGSIFNQPKSTPAHPYPRLRIFGETEAYPRLRIFGETEAVSLLLLNENGKWRMENDQRTGLIFNDPLSVFQLNKIFNYQLSIIN